MKDVQDFYNNDKEGKQIFLQYLFDSFYMHFIIRTSDSSIYYARGKVIGIE